MTSIASELITRGWHQGEWEGPDGSVCLYGATECAAIGYITMELLTDKELADKRSRYFRAIEQVVGPRVGEWNDVRGRTFDEVLRVAKVADEILDAQ